MSESVINRNDDAPGSEDLKPDYPLDSINHSAHEYVRGLVHTASIDSFWSLLKRGIMGNFHHVSKKYLPMYVNEFAWRHNQRKNPALSTIL
jgi:transposase-like protein